MIGIQRGYHGLDFSQAAQVARAGIQRAREVYQEDPETWQQLVSAGAGAIATARAKAQERRDEAALYRVPDYSMPAQLQVTQPVQPVQQGGGWLPIVAAVGAVGLMLFLASRARRPAHRALR